MGQGISVVSLYDGISCGRLALDRAGYAVSSYAAFETDKFARAVSRYNHPDITQHGDVFDTDFSRFVGADLVIGGSPCQNFSIAKARREVDKGGEGWKLFMRFAEAIRQIKPRFFLFENVATMHREIRKHISDELGCKPVLINSVLVSAQQRKRLYWTNIPGTTQPEDRGILLKDILETGLAAREKSYCIDACYSKGIGKNRLGIQDGRRQLVYEPITSHENALSSPNKCRKTRRFFAQEIIDAGGTIPAADIPFPLCVGFIGANSQGNRVYSVHGKTISIMAYGGGRGGCVGLYKVDLPDGGYTVRKLTNIEAERCQTLPDNYTALGVDDKGETMKISPTQRYKCVGNGFTVDVIAHILSHIKGENDELY
ncbi:MAG: DNA cytosine methyltransferase [Clostridiales bacterium]|nr:DNA cytosine methyltransferase [Clostridiales bacterium]